MDETTNNVPNMPSSGFGSKPPYKFDLEKRTKYLELVASGLRRGKAAAAVGVTRETTNYWKLKDPEFALAESQAEMDACEIVEDVAWNKIVEEGDRMLLMFWLQNRFPSRWKDCRNSTIIKEVLASEPNIEEMKKKLTIELAKLEQLDKDKEKDAKSAAE